VGAAQAENDLVVYRVELRFRANRPLWEPDIACLAMDASTAAVRGAALTQPVARASVIALLSRLKVISLVDE
jgi:hypothetical protein